MQFYVWYHEDEFILLSKYTDASVNEIQAPEPRKKAGFKHVQSRDLTYEWQR